jgi:hypothetical protein
VVRVDPHVPWTACTRIGEYPYRAHIVRYSNALLSDGGNFLNSILVSVAGVNSFGFLGKLDSFTAPFQIEFNIEGVDPLLQLQIDYRNLIGNVFIK